MRKITTLFVLICLLLGCQGDGRKVYYPSGLCKCCVDENSDRRRYAYGCLEVCLSSTVEDKPLDEAVGSLRSALKIEDK